MRGDPCGFYVSGGAVPRDASCYVERAADIALFDSLARGEFTYVLTSRQMGKSSLMVRTAAQLRRQGVRAATLDLSGIGHNLTPVQWYRGLLTLAAQGLGLEEAATARWRELADHGPVQRLMRVVREVLLPAEPSPLVLFLDEVDAVQSLPFRTDEFFAAIRECYNGREESPALRRLHFCLFGVVSPSELIRDVRATPFNIGTRLELGDFTEEEAAPLAAGFAAAAEGPVRPRELLRRVLYWTGGQPYLTQRLCAAVVASPEWHSGRGAPTPAVVDRVCERTFLAAEARSREVHLGFIADRLLRPAEGGPDTAALLQLYAEVLRGRRPRCLEREPQVQLLLLAGVVRWRNGRLEPRNRIYSRVFSLAWVRSSLPDSEMRRQRRAFLRGAARGLALGGVALAGVSAVTAVLAAREHEARSSLAALQLERGAHRLEGGDPSGLLDFLEARRVTPSRAQADSAERLWANWYSHLQGKLLGTTSISGQPELLEYSPDGTRLAVGTRSGKLHLLGGATLAPQRTLEAGGAPSFLRFSPRGTYLAAIVPGAVRVWPVEGGAAHSWPAAGARQLGWSADEGTLAWWGSGGARVLRLGSGSPRPVSLTSEPVLSGALGSGGDRLYLAEPQRVRLVETVSGRILRERPIAAGSILEVARSGRRLAVLSGGSPLLLDAQTLLPAATLSGLHRPASGLRFSEDGRRLATISNTVAQLWEAETGAPVGAVHGGNHIIRDVALPLTGEPLLAVLADRRITVWDVAAGAPRGLAAAAPERIAAVAWHPRRELLAAALEGGGLSSRRFPGPGGALRVAPPSGDVRFLRFAEDGAVLVVAAGREVHRYHARDARRIHGPVVLPARPMALSPNGRYALVPREGRTELWDTVTGWRAGEPGAGEEREAIAAFSRDSAQLAMMTVGGGAAVLETRSGLRRVTLGLPASPVERLEFAPDGATLAMHARDHLQLWDIRAGRPLGLPVPYTGATPAVTFLEDSEHLAVAGGEGVQLIDFRTGQTTGRLPHPYRVVRLAAGPGALLATATSRGAVRVWDARTGRVLGPVIELPSVPVSLQFSPEGALLLIRTGVDTAQLWAWRTALPAGPELRVPGGMLRPEFQPGGPRLAVGGPQAVRLYRLASSRVPLAEAARRTQAELGLALEPQSEAPAWPWRFPFLPR